MGEFTHAINRAGRWKVGRGKARVRTAPQDAWLINASPYPSVPSSILHGVPAEEPPKTLMNWVGMYMWGCPAGDPGSPEEFSIREEAGASHWSFKALQRGPPPLAQEVLGFPWPILTCIFSIISNRSVFCNRDGREVSPEGSTADTVKPETG